MAQKKAYSRYFIILQQDENGYSLASDKLPSGYAKLEIKNDKCKISYYVQNLKKEMEPYHMALICNKKDVKKLIKLGNMNIDDFGRAEITFEYSVDNVAGSGIPADMISGAAIIKFVNSSIISVMSGFSTTDVPIGWKNYEAFELSREEEIRRAEEVIEPAAEPEEEKPQEENTQEEKPEERLQEEIIPEEKVEETPEPVEETREEKVSEEVILEEKNIFEEYEKKIDEAREQLEPVETVNAVQEEPQQDNTSEPAGIVEEIIESREEVSIPDENREEDSLPKEQIEMPSEPVEEKVDETERSKEHKHHECKEEKCEKEKEKCEKGKDKEDHPSGTVGDFFKALAEGFEEVKEGCKEIKRCKWYKIKVENMDDMCNTADYNKYTLIYYPMISYYPYIKKHGHYLLGYKYDINGKMKYIVYGMPGTKSKLDQPYGGKSGFVTWVPLKEGDEAEDSFGYWLMFYDFRTSTIVIPVK